MKQSGSIFGYRHIFKIDLSFFYSFLTAPDFYKAALFEPLKK